MMDFGAFPDFKERWVVVLGAITVGNDSYKEKPLMYGGTMDEGRWFMLYIRDLRLPRVIGTNRDAMRMVLIESQKYQRHEQYVQFTKLDGAWYFHQGRVITRVKNVITSSSIMGTGTVVHGTEFLEEFITKSRNDDYSMNG